MAVCKWVNLVNDFGNTLYGYFFTFALKVLYVNPILLYFWDLHFFFFLGRWLLCIWWLLHQAKCRYTSNTKHCFWLYLLSFEILWVKSLHHYKIIWWIWIFSWIELGWTLMIYKWINDLICGPHWLLFLRDDFSWMFHFTSPELSKTFHQYWERKS